MVKVNFLFVSSGSSGKLSGVCFSIFGLIFFWGLFLENLQASTQIDSNISQAIRNAIKISMWKNIFGDKRVETTVTAEKISFKRNTVDVWLSYGYFQQQACEWTGKEKKRLPENRYKMSY